MRTRRSTGATALVATALVLGSVWAMAPDRPAVVLRGSEHVSLFERGLAGAIASVDLPDLAAESLLTAPRPIHPGPGPLWALPGLAAALAALCLLRRLRACPPVAAHRARRRGSDWHRGPPVGSLA